MANQPAKHGRDHLPSGYAAVVQPFSDPADLLPEGSADQLRSIASTSSGGSSVAAVVSLNINTTATITANTWTLVVPGDGSREWASGFRSDGSWIVDLDSANSIERSEDAFYVAYGWVNFGGTTAGQAIGAGIRWRNTGGQFYPNLNVAVGTDTTVLVTSPFWGVPSPGTDLWCYTSATEDIVAAELHVRRFELSSAGELLP